MKIKLLNVVSLNNADTVEKIQEFNSPWVIND